MSAILERRSTTTRPAVVYRPESAVFWVYVAAVALGTLSLLSADGTVIHESLSAQIALAPVWLAFIAFLVWLMLRFDPYRSMRRYPQILVAATALGGTAAVAMAMEGNAALGDVWARVLRPDVLAEWQAALTAPFIEESAKAACAAVVLVLCGAVCTRIAHALLVGMFVGFGFDVVEDLAYASGEALDSLDSDVVGAGANLVVRILTAVPAHWAFTSLTSVAVLLLLPTFADRTAWPRRRRWATAAGLVAAAWFMHFAWDAPNPDGPAALAALLGKVLLNLTVFLVPALLLLRTERSWVATQIDEAKRSGTLTDYADVLDSLPTRRTRRALRRHARRTGGRAATKAVRARQNAALDAIQAGVSVAEPRWA
ncbi:PrsW family glutamic-type intramembrane protease [Mycolicibacterium phlei]